VSNLFNRISVAAKDQRIAAARGIWWQEGAWLDVMRRRPTECRAAEQCSIIDDVGGRPWLDEGLISRTVTNIKDLPAVLNTLSLIINGDYDLPDFLAIADDLEAICPAREGRRSPRAAAFRYGVSRSRQ
jgi:hypothetical protein